MPIEVLDETKQCINDQLIQVNTIISLIRIFDVAVQVYPSHLHFYEALRLHSNSNLVVTTLYFVSDL